jgi:hypothetical protein
MSRKTLILLFGMVGSAKPRIGSWDPLNMRTKGILGLFRGRANFGEDKTPTGLRSMDIFRIDMEIEIEIRRQSAECHFYYSILCCFFPRRKKAVMPL